ncbi:MAG TPA: hypothetical protein DCZ06_03375, partial [Alphaproteobacteria bacterium]|nr:hypothetical protein [Alphaproteobacteria bacterium]
MGMTGKLSGQVAIVTGAAQGIGRAICERLAADGASLMMADVDADGLKEAVAVVSRAGQVEIATHIGDLSEEAVANELIKATVERWGRIDILVNNAG